MYLKIREIKDNTDTNTWHKAFHAAGRYLLNSRQVAHTITVVIVITAVVPQLFISRSLYNSFFLRPTYFAII